MQLQLYEWVLRYSTEQHGCSLRTAYSRVQHSGGPTLLVVRDQQGATFGGFASEPWHPSPSYYGNGECFLFRTRAAQPEQLDAYAWTGANSHFQLGFADSIAFGGGGQFGVWLDEAFEYGSSGRCDTFGNDVLSSTPDFKVRRLEIWGFEYSCRSPGCSPLVATSPSGGMHFTDDATLPSPLRESSSALFFNGAQQAPSPPSKRRGEIGAAAAAAAAKAATALGFAQVAGIVRDRGGGMFR